MDSIHVCPNRSLPQVAYCVERGATVVPGAGRRLRQGLVETLTPTPLPYQTKKSSSTRTRNSATRLRRRSFVSNTWHCISNAVATTMASGVIIPYRARSAAALPAAATLTETSVKLRLCSRRSRYSNSRVVAPFRIGSVSTSVRVMTDPDSRSLVPLRPELVHVFLRVNPLP